MMFNNLYYLYLFTVLIMFGYEIMIKLLKLLNLIF